MRLFRKQLHGLRLRLTQHHDVRASATWHVILTRRLQHIPCSHHDLLLKLQQLFRLLVALLALLTLLLLLLLLLTLRLLLALAIDFLEIANFGKVHITYSAPCLTFRIAVLGPNVIRKKLTRLSTKRLEVDHLAQDHLFAFAGLQLRLTFHNLTTRKLKAHTRRSDFEIVFQFCGDIKLLDRRNLRIPAGCELDLSFTIRKDFGAQRDVGIVIATSRVD